METQLMLGWISFTTFYGKNVTDDVTASKILRSNVKLILLWQTIVVLF